MGKFNLGNALKGKFEDKFGGVVDEFKKGSLHNGKSKKIVSKRNQAIAIAISESRKKTGMRKWLKKGV